MSRRKSISREKSTNTQKTVCRSHERYRVTTLPLKSRNMETSDGTQHLNQVPILTPTEIRQEFIREAKLTWNNSEIIDRIQLDIQVQKRPYAMSLSYSNRPRAIGDMLIQAPSRMTLHIDPSTLMLPKGEIMAAIRHETVHIGYPKHDERFREVANKHGIPITTSLFKGGQYKIQAKLGTRYQTVAVVETLPAAKEEARKLRAEGKYGRMRIEF